jgi:hypothetical protein
MNHHLIPMVRPMGYDGYPPGRGNMYSSPYGVSAGGRAHFSNDYLKASLNAAYRRPQRQRHFGRSYRWGAALGGQRPRPFRTVQSPYQLIARHEQPGLGYPRTHFNAQARAYSAVPRMARYRATAPAPIHRVRPMQPVHARRYGPPSARFTVPPIPRGFPPSRPLYPRRRAYPLPEEDEDEEDDDDDDDDDAYWNDQDDWSSHETEDRYDWESNGDDDGYGDCYYGGAGYGPYGSYTTRYDEDDDDEYSYSMDSRSYGYPRPYAPPYRTW